MMKCSIRESFISIQPSTKLIDFIKNLKDPSINLPPNLLQVYRNLTNDYQDHAIAQRSTPIAKYSNEETKLLADLSSDRIQIQNFEQQLESMSYSQPDDNIETIPSEGITEITNKTNARLTNGKCDSEIGLSLVDLKWINQYLGERRRANIDDKHLHELMAECHILLPQNEYVERNAELEKRCKQLRREQEEKCYRAMTRNVDVSQGYFPNDTISFQLKQINRHMIAVLQFIFSVLAGFAFGFIGVELLIGDLDFGFRLLLGIIFSLIIALAEIYFLAKKLNEEYDTQNVREHAD